MAATTTTRTTFTGHGGEELAARLDLPAGSVRGYALFAHCFTCSKDLFAARQISQSLAQYGFAVLRVRREAIDVTFYGYERGSPEDFGVIYETTIEPRSRD